MIPRSRYPSPDKGRVIVWGMLAHHPFGGMTWQVLHHIVGIRRLGFDAWYVEDSDVPVSDPTTLWQTSDVAPSIAYLQRMMTAIGPYDDHGGEASTVASMLEKAGHEAAFVDVGGPQRLPAGNRYRRSRLAIGADTNLSHALERTP
jgi:hypothetical protein